MNSKATGEQPDRQQSQWLEQIPEKLRKNLVRIGLLDTKRAAAGKPLSQHLDDFKQHLLAKGITAKQAQQVFNRSKRIVDGCRFVNWGDISASQVQKFLADLLDNGAGISAQTFNFYLQAIKHFSRWMVQDQRDSEQAAATGTDDIESPPQKTTWRKTWRFCAENNGFPRTITDR